MYCGLCHCAAKIFKIEDECSFTSSADISAMYYHTSLWDCEDNIVRMPVTMARSITAVHNTTTQPVAPLAIYAESINVCIFTDECNVMRLLYMHIPWHSHSNANLRQSQSY